MTTLPDSPLTKDEVIALKSGAADGEITTSEIVAMAWDDETSFDAIERITGLPEKEVILLMRSNMKPSSFRMWRKRVHGRKAKHEAKLR